MLLAGCARAGADPLQWGDVVSGSTAHLPLGLESFLGNPYVPAGGMAKLEAGGGLGVPPERGRAWVQHPGARTFLPCASLNLASRLGQEFVLGKHR